LKVSLVFVLRDVQEKKQSGDGDHGFFFFFFLPPSSSPFLQYWRSFIKGEAAEGAMPDKQKKEETAKPFFPPLPPPLSSPSDAQAEDSL